MGLSQKHKSTEDAKALMTLVKYKTKSVRTKVVCGHTQPWKLFYFFGLDSIEVTVHSADSTISVMLKKESSYDPLGNPVYTATHETATHSEIMFRFSSTNGVSCVCYVYMCVCSPDSFRPEVS